MMPKRSALIVILLIASSGFAADEASKNDTSSGSGSLKNKSYIKNRLDLRDPFKRKINKKKAQIQTTIKAQDTSNFSNYKMTLEGVPLESIKIVGIITGTERRAVVKVLAATGKESSVDRDELFYVKEGMRLGENNAEVKAILPGGVVLVEKIRNVYDQDEYLETIIPLSNE